MRKFTVSSGLKPAVCLFIGWLCVIVLLAGAGNRIIEAQDDNGGSRSLDEVKAYTGIAAWHQAGYDGSGVKAGIIDVGFAGVDVLLSDFTLADNVEREQVLHARSNHGTQVLEVLMAMAPGAEFYLYQLKSGGHDLQESMDWMLAQNVDVLNLSVSGLQIPLNGDNSQAQMVNHLVNNDILVVVSAGNYGVGVIADTFKDGGDGWHEFANGYRSIEVWPFFTQTYSEAHLRWQDIYTSAELDLDIYIIAGDGTTIAASTRVQEGGSADWPYEDILFPTTAGVPFYIAIQAKSTGVVPDGTPFSLYVRDSSVGKYATESSIVSPADSDRVLAVGAINADETLWWRSGRGPTWDGRIKPDLVAPTNLQLIYHSDETFTGNSYSTPIVAGAAAIARGAFPALSEAEIRAWILQYAIDLGDPGPDNLFGRGRLWLPAPESVIVQP